VGELDARAAGRHAASTVQAAGRLRQPRHRRTAAYVGLALLLVILIEAATGWLLWVAAHRQASLASAFLASLPRDWTSRPILRWLFDVRNETDLHTWFGYLLLGLTGVKLWAVWWLLRHWFPRRFRRRRLLFEKVAAWSLPLIYGVILVTGVMLDENLGLVRGRDTVRDLHLWSSELALPVTVWHLIRFLPTSWQIARHDAARWRRTERPAQSAR
jgi:hypothetical protein